MSEDVEPALLERDTQLVRDDLCSCEHSNVFEVCFTGVSETGGLDGGDLDSGAEFVDDQSSQSLGLDVFGHDQ